MQLFDWVYPRYLSLFTKAVELWYNEVESILLNYLHDAFFHSLN